MVVGVLLATLIVTDQHQGVRLQADGAARAGVASAVAQVGESIRTQLAAAAAAPGPADSTVPVGEVGRSAVSPASAAVARDSGTPVLDDLAATPTIVVPVYRSGATPLRTADRRGSITAYRLVPLALGPVLAGLVPDGGGMVLRGPRHQVITAPGPVPGGARAFSTGVDVARSPGWVLEAWLPDPATPGVTWIWVLGLLGLCGGLSAAGASLHRRAVAAAARQVRLERHRSLIAGLAPVVQSSLDLAEVAPAISAHLAQTLALTGLSLSTPAATGERELFTWGGSPDAGVQPFAQAPTRLESDQTFAMSLSRGGRALGVLRVVAGETLLREDLDALSTAAELLSSTLANVEEFARQQLLVARLRSLDELKTNFLATASHELRTPVTAIIGFSALLLEQGVDLGAEQSRMFLERVHTNACGLGALIEQLLDISQLENGPPAAEAELLDLGPTITTILAERPELVAGHGLSSELAPGCLVRGSTVALERIVTNLVGNAAKYAPEGTRITVAVRADGDRAALVVDDEGPGVPAEDRDQIFNRFYRGHGDPVTRTKGVGIGLAIVAEYAASMAGVATVAQAPSGGARFIVSFPAVGPLADAVGGLPVAQRNGAVHVPCS